MAQKAPSLISPSGNSARGACTNYLVSQPCPVGKVPNNFVLTMPPLDSDMATQIFKDPYLFDFLGTADTRKEPEVEQALVDHVQKFLLELGAGFAFVGRQVLLEGGDE
jgi:predicted nuclease of restriction endonuclease-like (RecB) superfamily